MKKILIYGLLLFSANIFAQNLPSGQVWGNTKLQGFTSNQDSSGFISLDQIKTFTNAGTGSGTVTSVSVASANGFAGTVATATTTPAITISTTATGVLKGNGTAISAATSGTDYSAGTNALTTGILKSTTTTGALSIAVAADFPTLNQNTTGNAATVTTNANLTGNVTSVGNVTTIPSATVTNAMLVNSNILLNGVSTALGSTRDITLQQITTAGASTSTLTSFSGGLTQGGNFVASNTALSTTTTLTTASNSDIEADATSAAFTITLPSAPTVGTTFWITKKNSTTNYVTVSRGGSDTIMGNNTHVIISADSPTGFKYLSGAKWRIIQ